MKISASLPRDITDVVYSQDMSDHLQRLVNSYEKLFAEPLISAGSKLADSLWQADFVLLSHGTEADPVFNFANQMALELFEMSFQDITSLPSRKSAEPVSQEERNRLLAEVIAHGCINDYTGVRISATGRRFYIENARVWNISDAAGEYAGQAAMFRHWRYL